MGSHRLLTDDDATTTEQGPTALDDALDDTEAGEDNLSTSFMPQPQNIQT